MTTYAVSLYTVSSSHLDRIILLYINECASIRNIHVLIKNTVQLHYFQNGKKMQISQLFGIFIYEILMLIVFTFLLF